MSKSFYIADSNKKAIAVSLEEALARKLTYWKGWFCSAGYDNIHITADGNVYVATCKVGGLITNIFDSFGGLPTQWIKCYKDVCTCGSDMQLRKTKQYKNIPVAKDLKTTEITYIDGTIEESEREFVGPVFDELNTPTCTWDLGRRCNYSCDYCNDSISNNYEAHKSWGSLEFAYNKVKNLFIRDRKVVKFIFTGGEPTINPSYMKLVQAIHADGHLIHTQTNGSLTPDYYSELIKYSFIGISTHLKFYNKERFFRNVQAILDTKNADEKAGRNWFGIRIMAPPGRGQEAVNLYEELMEKFKFDQVQNNIHLCHTYMKNDSEKLEEYPEDEFKLIEKYT